MKNWLSRGGRRGSVYLLILILASAFGLLVYSMLSYQSSEVVNNYAYVLRKQARLANESLFFLACEDLKTIYDTDPDSLMPGSEVKVDLPIDQLKAILPPTTFAEYDLDNTEVVVGRLSEWSLRYVGIDVPNSEQSQFLNQLHSYRNVPLYTKVTLVGTKGVRATCYAKSTFAVKAAPVTSYAVFFNADLAEYAGPDLIVNGRVHVNEDFALGPDSGTAKHMYVDKVTVAGKIRMWNRTNNTLTKDNTNKARYGFANGNFTNGIPDTTVNDDMTTSDTNVTIDNVKYQIRKFNTFGQNFNSLQGNPTNNPDYGVNPYKNWMDDYMTDQDFGWKELALKNWNGMLKTSTHGVQKITIPGMDRYELPPATSGASTPWENASPAYQWDPKNPAYYNTAYQMIQPVRNANDEALTTSAESAKNKTREKAKMAYNAGLIIEVKGSSGTQYINPAYKTKDKMTVDLHPDTVTYSAYYYKRDNEGALVYDNSGNPVKVNLGDPKALGIVETVPYVTSTGVTSTGTLNSGIWDARRKEAVNLVKVDISKLKQVIDNHNSLTSSKRFAEDPVANDLTQGWWNGSVYVQWPTASKNTRNADGSAAPAQDGVQPAVDKWGLYIQNGSSLPEKGLTISTNNVVYLKGNYNADGNPKSAGQVNAATDPEAGEVPAAIIADSVYLLSNAWNDANSRDYSLRKAANVTEYATAIITGNSPMGRNTATGVASESGGLHNFMRFLENWDGKQMIYRGSLVCLFDAEVSDDKFGQSNVYQPPKRIFGYNKLFEKNVPPGIPLGGFSGPGFFAEIDAAEWEEEVAKLKES